jgi:hypothetical protein
MQELPDDQLDGLFRKSLEESEPPYDPAAWPIMAEKLAGHDRQRFWQRWLRRVVPVVVALVLPVSLWLLTRDSPSADPTSNARSTQLADGKADDAHAGASPSATIAMNDVDGATTADTAVAKPAPGRDESADQRTTSTIPAANTSRPHSSALVMRPSERGEQKQPGKARSAPNATGLPERMELTAQTPLARAYATMARPKRMRVREQIDQLIAVPTAPFIGGRGAERSASGGMERAINPQRTVAAGVESVGDRFQLSIEPLRNRSFSTVGRFPAIDRLMAAPASGEQAPVVNRDRTTGLSLRAMVSPDLSSVGLTNFSRPGTNVGLMLEYQFHRWHVQAGVLRSVKVYQANESAYEYSAVRQWPVVPSSINGRCNMLDIPINLRYDVALIARQRALPPSRWFVSAGATTYYMLREDYTYRYDDPADPKIKYRDWTTETGRYGFSQLNLSAGYERAVTQRLFWQVEPFLKVPLKGVGYYKINLLSTGAFFSLRYRL